ncbi:aquaporin [Streptomyces microflavus]
MALRAGRVRGRRAAFALLGAGVGALLAVLMVSAPGRRSGGHLNPAVTLALWRLGAFPGGMWCRTWWRS